MHVLKNYVSLVAFGQLLGALHYRGADKSLARPTSRCILFDGENISFDASLVAFINSINIPPIMIINRIYENQNLLSLYLVSFLVGLRTYQHSCIRITCLVGCISASVGGTRMANSYVPPYADSFKTLQVVLRSVKLKGTLLAEECAFSALSELLEGIS